MYRKLILIAVLFALAGCNQFTEEPSGGIYGDSVAVTPEPIPTDFGPDDTIKGTSNSPEHSVPYFVECPDAPTPENDYCALVAIEARHWDEVSGLGLFVTDTNAAHVVIVPRDTERSCGLTHHEDNGDCILTLNIYNPACDIHHVIEHELGHCVGLGHAIDEASIMNIPVTPVQRITTANVQWLTNNFQGGAYGEDL